MKEVIAWHPRVNCYRLGNNSLILIGENGSFSLSSQDFPFFYLVDGKRSVEEIGSIAGMAVEQYTKFMYQLSLLKKQSVLCSIGDSSDYVEVGDSFSFLDINCSSISISNFSSISRKEVDFWEGFLSGISVSSREYITFVFVDSFIDFDFGSVEGEVGKVIFIKPTGNKIWILPPVSLLDVQSFGGRLKEVLLSNNPALSFVKRAFFNDKRCIPFIRGKVVSSELYEDFKLVFEQYLLSERFELIVFDKDSGRQEFHPLSLVNYDQGSFSDQVNEAIVLKACTADFNRDGGSRSVSPDVTVNRLKEFISPATGIITHLKELDGNGSNPVKIYETAFFKTPAVKDVDKISNGGFVQRCLGKGVTHIQSKASALCEAIERFSALYQGNEPLFLSSEADLGSRNYNFQDLVPYSMEQYEKFCDPSNPDSSLKQAAIRYSGEPVYWIPTWSLTNKDQVYVPLTSCFSNIPFDDDRFARWHSNGCAAGNTLEEAILQALFELIERDATAIWWYNQVERPKFDIREIDSEYLTPLKETLEPTHDFWVLDLTHDVGVPVMAAIGQDKETKGISFGFGCHLLKSLAAQRALTELCQLIPIRDQNGASFDFNAVEDGAYLYPSDRFVAEHSKVNSSGDIKEDILSIVSRLGQLSMEVLVLNYSRDPLPIKTAKVFVPGLCHIWPQLANERLYEVPVKAGWTKVSNSEQSINSQPLYI